MTDVDAEARRVARVPVGWRIVSLLGEVLITVGVLFLLLVVYDLWWTNVRADRVINAEREQLISAWEGDPTPRLPDVPTPPIPSEAFGLMYIPRLKPDVWATPLIEGVENGDLARGIGHMPGTALPGEVGNAAFAGHRATHGEPLRYVDQLQPGDLVFIQTIDGWYTYRLREDQLVRPTDIWVADPVPGAPTGTPPTEPVLTLITCHPRWGSTQRWVWWGDLVDTQPNSEGAPAELARIMRGG